MMIEVTSDVRYSAQYHKFLPKPTDAIGLKGQTTLPNELSLP